MISFSSLKRLLLGSSLRLPAQVHPGPCLALVHLGNEWPSYVSDCVRQVIRFNPTLPVYFVASSIHRSQLPSDVASHIHLRWVDLESLKRSRPHRRFLRQSKLDTQFRGGFWRFATERFFILDELIRTYRLQDCFHIENDNVIYVSIPDLLAPLHRKQIQIAVPFDNDERCIPSFVYFRDEDASSRLANYLAGASRSEALNDMQTLAMYRKVSAGGLSSLPIVPPGFECDWTTPSGKKSQEPGLFTHLAADLGSVFDAAALGQYLGGVDAPDRKIGFINESCVFNPASLTIEWHSDEQGRKIPSILWKNERFRINNLHIHSKQLRSFLS